MIGHGSLCILLNTSSYCILHYATTKIYLTGLTGFDGSTYFRPLREARKTLTLDREFTDVKRVMAEAYHRKGLHERSVSCWEQYTAGYRNKLEGHLALVELYSKTGQTEKLDRTIARVMV